MQFGMSGSKRAGFIGPKQMAPVDVDLPPGSMRYSPAETRPPQRIKLRLIVGPLCAAEMGNRFESMLFLHACMRACFSGKVLSDWCKSIQSMSSAQLNFEIKKREREIRLTTGGQRDRRDALGFLSGRWFA
jgi:hypothetical protein